ncbi:hypothetical protein [Streptomyces sp. NPDC050485]|uniref:hypothetical protein n=1 Tax=Streptomyces sp. NPDC050485 TaxID=3365617 RepID=UPI0037B5A54B
MNKDEMDWGYLANLAGRIAYAIAERWQIVEADDVKQEIMMHALNERHIIAEHYADEDFLRKIFWKAGQRYAAKERNYRDLMDGEYYYTPDDAKAALRTFLYTDEEFGELIGKKDDLSSCKVTDNLFVARQDAEAGLKKVNERYRKLLMKRFVYGLSMDNNADQIALARAVVALSYEMNRNLRREAQVA